MSHDPTDGGGFAPDNARQMIEAASAYAQREMLPEARQALQRARSALAERSDVGPAHWCNACLVALEIAARGGDVQGMEVEAAQLHALSGGGQYWAEQARARIAKSSGRVDPARLDRVFAVLSGSALPSASPADAFRAPPPPERTGRGLIAPTPRPTPPEPRSTDEPAAHADALEPPAVPTVSPELAELPEVAESPELPVAAPRSEAVAPKSREEPASEALAPPPPAAGSFAVPATPTARTSHPFGTFVAPAAPPETSASDTFTAPAGSPETSASNALAPPAIPLKVSGSDAFAAPASPTPVTDACDTFADAPPVAPSSSRARSSDVSATAPAAPAASERAATAASNERQSAASIGLAGDLPAATPEPPRASEPAPERVYRGAAWGGAWGTFVRDEPSADRLPAESISTSAGDPSVYRPDDTGDEWMDRLAELADVADDDLPLIFVHDEAGPVDARLRVTPDRTDAEELLRSFVDHMTRWRDDVSDEEAENFYDLGTSFLDMEQWESAVKVFDQAMRNPSTRVAAAEGYLKALLGMGDDHAAFGAAGLALSNLASAGEPLSGILFLRGQAAERIGDPREARRCYQETLRIDRFHADARERLAALGE